VRAFPELRLWEGSKGRSIKIDLLFKLTQLKVKVKKEVYL